MGWRRVKLYTKCHSPIRNKGIEIKNPAIAQVLVIAAFFRYLEVLKIENTD